MRYLSVRCLSKNILRRYRSKELRISGWLLVLLLCSLPARLATVPGAWLHWGLFFILLFLFSTIYWYLGPYFHAYLDLTTGRLTMEVLGEAVLEKGWEIRLDISGPALFGKYKGCPVRFQRLTSQTKFCVGDMVLLLEWPIKKDFDYPAEHVQIEGFKKLFGIASSGPHISRLGSQPIQWLGRTGLLLRVHRDAPLQADAEKFREALDVLLCIALKV